MADGRVILVGDSILDNRCYALNSTPSILEKGARGRFINLSVELTRTEDFDYATRVVPEDFYKAAEKTDTPYADKTVKLFPEVSGVKYVILSVGGNDMLEMLQMLPAMNRNKSATMKREFEIQWEAEVVKELSKRIIKVLDKYKTTYPDATITYVKPYYMTEAMHKAMDNRFQTGVTFEVLNRVLDKVIHKIRNKYYILEPGWGDEDVAISEYGIPEPTTKGALLLAEKIEEWVNEEGEKQHGIDGKDKGKGKGKEEEEEEEEVEAPTPIPLRSTFPVDRLAKGDREPAICRAVPVASGRCFGPFKEMALECNAPAREAIDRVCFEGGFTQSWSGEVSSDGFSLLTKIPAIILVKLMLGIQEECEKEVLSLRGAYGICMAPNQRTCMNVVVGRRPSGNGYVLDKFSLYYPDNSAVPSEWHTTGWDLLHGYSFRTAALTGTLNRGGLAGLRDGPACRDHGLVIDRDSAYEDCAYIGVREGESKEDRMRRIEGMVTVMEEVYGGSLLAFSYDPEEKARGVTVLRSEWELLKRQLSLQPSAGGGGGGSSSVIVEAKNGKGVLDPMNPAPVAEEQHGIEGKGKEEEEESAPRSQKQGTLPLWHGITDLLPGSTTNVKVRLGERLEDGILISDQPFDIISRTPYAGKVVVELSNPKREVMLVRKEDVYITNEEEEGDEGEEEEPKLLTRAEELRNEDIYRPRPLTKNKFQALACINEINLLQIYTTSKKRSDYLWNGQYGPSDEMYKFKEVNRIGEDMPISFDHYNIFTFTKDYTKFGDTYPTGSMVTTLDDMVDEFPLPNERVERLKMVAQAAAEQMANENKIIVCVCRGANHSRLLAQMILCYLRIRWYGFYRIAFNSRLLPDDKKYVLPRNRQLMQYVNKIEAEEEALIEKARSSNDEEEGDEEEEKARVGKRPSLRSVPRLSPDLLVPEVPECWNTQQSRTVGSFNEVVLNESPPDVSDLRVGDVVEVMYKRHNEERLYYIVAIDDEMLLVLELKDEGNNTLKHVGEDLCSINRHLLNRVMVRVDSEEEEEESVEEASSHWRRPGDWRRPIVSCQKHEHCHKANGHRGRCKIRPPKPTPEEEEAPTEEEEAPNHEEESSKKKGKRRKLHM
tara:strand:+ start:710 stop:4036 length:3327 start_codon:yes stop_codon:yes gene_type:complete